MSAPLEPQPRARSTARAARARNRRAGAVAVPPPPPPPPPPPAREPEPPAPQVAARSRRGLFGVRRPNRKITFDNRSLLLWLLEGIGRLARRMVIVAKVLAALAVLAATVWLGRIVIHHVVASSRFALREIRVGPSAHLGREQIEALAGIGLGDPLLDLDTDQVAARLARHPWIAAARVQRQLPGTLVIEVTERRAAAVATLGALYLLDESGHAFKQATIEETEGLVVLTGLTREQYSGRRDASESAFREALALLNSYRQPGRGAARPDLSEIHVDPRSGFSLFLYDTGAEIRLGRDGIAEKLGRLDEILGALGPNGLAATRVIHLDGPAKDRIPIRLAEAEPADGVALNSAGDQKVRASAASGSKPPGGAASPRRPERPTGGAREGEHARAEGAQPPPSHVEKVKKSTAAHNPVIPGKRSVPAASVAPAASPADLETD